MFRKHSPLLLRNIESILFPGVDAVRNKICPLFILVHVVMYLKSTVNEATLMVQLVKGYQQQRHNNQESKFFLQVPAMAKSTI